MADNEINLSKETLRALVNRLNEVGARQDTLTDEEWGSFFVEAKVLIAIDRPQGTLIGLLPACMTTKAFGSHLGQLP